MQEIIFEIYDYLPTEIRLIKAISPKAYLLARAPFSIGMKRPTSASSCRKTSHWFLAQEHS